MQKVAVLVMEEAFVFAVLGVILFGAAFGYWLIQSIADSTLQVVGVKAMVVISGGREFPSVVESIMNKSVITFGKEEIAAFFIWLLFIQVHIVYYYLLSLNHLN
ncbi:hypothetical protein Tco_0221391 [Tanacetum coccineum]